MGSSDVSLSPDSPLRDYFLSPGYWDGDLFPAEEHGYEATSLKAPPVEVFKHRGTGIIVWSLALDLRQRQGSTSQRVLFYYTNEETFKLLVEGGEKCTDRFLQSAIKLGSNFGLGPDASSQPPDRWTSQDELLINCRWPRQADFEKVHGSPMPTGSAAVDFIDTSMHSFIKERFPDAAAYCVPFLCHGAGVSNVLTTNTPALLMPAESHGMSVAREAGYNRFMDKEPSWRDVWTVDLWMLDAAGNVKLRTIPPTMWRLQMKRWEKHPMDVSIGIYLAFLLQAEGRQEEAVQVYRALLKLPNFSKHAHFAATMVEFTALRQGSEAEEMLREGLQQIAPASIEGGDSVKLSASLAKILQKKGSLKDLKEAEQLQRKVYEIRCMTMGEEHPDTLLSSDALAFSLASLGRFPEAAELYAKTLQGAMKAFGAKHPDTMCCSNNLACVLHGMGQLEQPENQFRRVLKRSRKALGKHHQHTLSSTNNLALFLKESGQLNGSLNLHNQLLQESRTALGELHPHTLACMDGLACVLDELGNQNASERLHREVVDKALVVLGPAHQETLRFRNNLACFLHAEGKLVEARQMYAEVWNIRRESLGSNHPDSLLSANNLACLLQDQQDLRQAIRIHQEVVAASREVLGERHPDTLKFSHDLAVALQKRRFSEEAEQLQRSVLDMQTETLGEKHPHTTQSQYTLGRLLWSRGQLDEAEKVLRRARQLQMEQFGANHPDTMRYTKRLEQLLRLKGEVAESQQLQEQVESVEGVTEAHKLGAKSAAASETLPSEDNSEQTRAVSSAYPRVSEEVPSGSVSRS